MKYTVEITINKPLAEVIKKLDNPDNMKHWQRGLIKHEIISGKGGEEGAKMKLNYDMGKRKVEMIETIIKNNFPHEFHATYDAEGVHNLQKNYFSEIDDHSTKWISETEFQFSSFFMKAMGFLMPGMFKKQSLIYLNDFKAFVEEGKSVADV